MENSEIEKKLKEIEKIVRENKEIVKDIRGYNRRKDFFKFVYYFALVVIAVFIWYYIGPIFGEILGAYSDVTNSISEVGDTLSDVKETAGEVDSFLDNFNFLNKDN